MSRKLSLRQSAQSVQHVLRGYTTLPQCTVALKPCHDNDHNLDGLIRNLTVAGLNAAFREQ